MSKRDAFRDFVNERLSVAAEEIFSLFERTIAEYEEELCRSKEENKRNLQHLESLCPRVQLLRADVDIPSADNRLHQEITDVLQTKEEPEEHSVKQEEDLLPVTSQELDSVHVKEDESLLLQQGQIEHLEEITGQDISSRPYYSEYSSNTYNGKDWEPPFSWSDAQLNSCMVAQNSSASLKCNPPSLHTGLNRVILSEADGGAERKYQCSICEKRFKAKQHLQVHMRVHTGEKPFRCSVCEKSFGHKGSLVIHRRIHTGEKPFRCVFCNTSYGHKGYLQKHMRTHTGEKPYTCQACGKSFAQKTNLEVHKRTHTGEKPYRCSICNTTFSQKFPRDAHMRTFHTAE